MGDGGGMGRPFETGNTLIHIRYLSDKGEFVLDVLGKICSGSLRKPLEQQIVSDVLVFLSFNDIQIYARLLEGSGDW